MDDVALFIYLVSMLHYFGVTLHAAIYTLVSFAGDTVTVQHHGTSHCVPFTVLNNTPT